MDRKQKIINAYLLGGKGYRVLAREYGVSRTTINRWVMCYQGRASTPRSGGNAVVLPLMQVEQIKEVLPQDVRELQRLLEQERLRNKLLTAVIEIAEEELKIPIRKKYGTKRFKK